MTDHRPVLDHHWRCRQDPVDIDRVVRTDLDVDPPEQIPVWRCGGCGGWTPMTPEEVTA